jgi:chemotaxis protein histidine kinase CheA
MDDLKSVTLDYLRGLARKHLGPGHSKLTKRELIAALAQFVPALRKVAQLAGIELPASAQPAAKAASPAAKPSRDPGSKESRAVDKKKQPEKKTAERKPEPEKKAPEKKAPEKKAPEKKVAEKKVAERKPVPERKAPEKKAPEKKGPEKKVAERKPEPEKRAPEKKAPEKKAPERKPEPEKKAPEKKAAETRPEPGKKAAESRPEPEKVPAAPQGRKAAPSRPATPKDEDLSQSSKPAQVVNFPPRPRSFRSAEEAWQEETAEMVVESPELERVFQHAAEPLIEGFFVARMMGERELRRHHLTEDQFPRPMVHAGAAARGFEENLGELPLDYGNDLALALARDPHTLFITWDFSPAVLARAREGLNAPRAMLRVFDGDRMVREEEIALESRSFYIHGLPPGRPYRVEAHFIGQDGRSRRIGHSTHPLVLPRTGPSPDTSVRFMQMPPPPRIPVQSVPPAGVGAASVSLEQPPPEEPLSEDPVEYGEERQYIQWRRIPLPGSAEMMESSESRLLRSARRARGEGSRPESPRPEYLEISARPPGSSEQNAGRGGPARGGSSEQTHWTPPPSGRGR